MRVNSLTLCLLFPGCTAGSQTSHPRGQKTATTFETLYAEAKTDFSWLQSTRRWFHENPELAFHEFHTSQHIQEELRSLNIANFSTGWGKLYNDDDQIGGTGIVVELGTGEAPCIVLRADIDALPIHEKTDVPYKSKFEGRMHACGHDAHTTMLLGAAKLLRMHEGELQGTVRLIFQPAEERDGGAKVMIENGLLQLEPKALEFYGAHVLPLARTGLIITRPGPILAGNSLFTWDFDSPEEALNAILETQSIVSKITSSKNEKSTGLVSLTSLVSTLSGARVMGTLRALDDRKVAEIRKALMDYAHTVIIGQKNSSRLHYNAAAYPATRNDPALFQWFERTMSDVISTRTFGAEDIESCDSKEGLYIQKSPQSQANVSEIKLQDIIKDPYVNIDDPGLASEDFSFFGQEVPSLFYYLGTGSGENPQTNFPLHSDFFALDERILPKGAAVMAYLAIERLKILHAQ